MRVIGNESEGVFRRFRSSGISFWWAWAWWKLKFFFFRFWILGFLEGGQGVPRSLKWAYACFFAFNFNFNGRERWEPLKLLKTSLKPS